MVQPIFSRDEARMLPRLHERQELEEAANAFAHPAGPWTLERRSWENAAGERLAALRCPIDPRKEARNQICGFGYQDLEAARPVLDWFDEAGCRAHVRVPGGDLRPDPAARMHAAGFLPMETEVWLSARPAAVVAPDPEIEIRMADDPAERALWADTLLKGWATPEAAHDLTRAALAPFPGPAHWRWMTARIGETVVGEALLVLFEDVDVAYLADAAVLPAARGRGVQRSLIAKRADIAEAEGFSRLFAGATYGSASCANMMKAGLIINEVSILWTRPSPGE